MENIRTSLGPAFVLALGIIIAAGIGAYAFYSVRAFSNTLAVTGSATEEVKADTAKWTVSVRRSAYESGLADAQTQVGKDAQTVVAYLISSKITADNVDMSPVYADQDYSKNQNGGPTAYNVHEDITVNSNDPALIQQLSKDIGSLYSRGIILSVQPPQYYVSNLPDIRIALIGKAVQDARARAFEIASSTGQRIGALQSASGGVVQVMAPNSMDSVSDYGSYDTSTIDKQVMVTSHAVFFLQ
jgi:hypothetical protein